MFDKIIYIGDRTCNVKLKDGTSPTFNLMNLHVVFEDSVKKILGEVDDIEKAIIEGTQDLSKSKIGSHI